MTNHNNHMSFRSEAARQKIADIEAALTFEALTMRQLAEKLGYPKKTLHAYAKFLRPRMHIADYEAFGPKWIPMWAWGVGESAPEPVATEVPAASRWAEPAQNLRPRRDPLVTAFFGAHA